MARGQYVLLAGKCDINPKMMPAELNHPRLRGRRHSKNRDVIFGTPERGRIALGRMDLCAGSCEILLGIDDVDHFFITHPAQSRCDNIQGSLLLHSREITELQTVAFERQSSSTI